VDIDPETDTPRLVRMHRLVGELVRTRSHEGGLIPKGLEDIIGHALSRSEFLENQWHNKEVRWEIEPLISFVEFLLTYSHKSAPMLVKYIAQWYQHVCPARRAELHHRKAIEILDKQSDADEPELAILSSNLGTFLTNEGEYGEAETLLRRALEIDERLREPDHPFIAIRLNNLALLLYSKGDYTNAEPLFRRALAIREEVLGPHHPDTARSLNNLAALLRKIGKIEEAQQLELKQLSIIADKPNAIPLELRQGAGAAYNLGDLDLAEKLLLRVLDADFEMPGTNCHLARICLLTDRIDEARNHTKDAWEHRNEAPPYVIPRILWFQILFALLDGADLASHLGRLKTALSADGSHMDWTMQPVLDYLNSKLNTQHSAILSALIAALSDPANLAVLDQFPECREAEPMPLE